MTDDEATPFNMTTGASRTLQHQFLEQYPSTIATVSTRLVSGRLAGGVNIVATALLKLRLAPIVSAVYASAVSANPSAVFGPARVRRRVACKMVWRLGQHLIRR